MGVDISVVVPIYNVENYLEQCLNSLLKQTLKNIEIILVDDGSPDNSGIIADEYAKKYNNIKVIHQKNSGLGPARNTGILHASGEYVGFVDSDDWVEGSMYNNLLVKARESSADVVFGGHKDVINDKIARIKPHPFAEKIITDKNQILDIRKKLFGHAVDDTEVEAYPMRVWTGIYKRNFLLKNKIMFENILSEDTIFNLSVYKFANIVAFVNNTDYCYRQDNQPSIMKTFSEKKLNQYVEFLERLNEIAVIDGKNAVIRVKRMAIDYERLYVGIVTDSNLSIKNKKIQIGRYAKNSIIKELWKNYPINSLPIQQRIFHFMLLNRQYGGVLVLSLIRQFMKRKGY